MHHTAISNDFLLQQLRWRYATKKFDPIREISDGDWKTLEEALILTPSAYGLQPWKFLVVGNPQTREALMGVSKGQRQVVDASQLVVFAIKANLTVSEIDAYVARIVEVRGVPAESVAGFRQLMIGRLIDGATPGQVNDWARRQAYIALGNFMTCAALMGIDTCAMEGFDPARYDEILQLPARGLAAAVACAAGYRTNDDKHATLAKVRFKAESLIEHL